VATSAALLLTRFSYPKVPGDQPWSIIDVTGPASYTEVTPGSPGPPVVAPTGGQEIWAQDFGLQAFDFVVAMGSNDGQYAGVIVPVGGTVTAPGEFTPGGDFESLLLMWMDLSTGLEATAATDLSASFLRLLAIGR
jgi:hypothetical protein